MRPQADHWELAANGAWPASLVIAFAVCIGVLAYFFYRRRRAALSTPRFYALVMLRSLAVLLLAAFLLQPVLRLTRTEAMRSTVAVLVDTSESMGIGDMLDGRTRLETAKALLLAQPDGVLARLAQTQRARVFAFGASTSEVTDARRLADLRPDQKATALGEALKDAVRTVRADDLAGIVLLTDGVSTRGEEPESVAPNLGVPVFPVALGGRPGERGRFHDVGIVRAPHDLRLIVNNAARLPLELSSAGLANLTPAERTLPLRLTEGTAELAATSVQMPAEDGAFAAELEFVPHEVGYHRLTASLGGLPNETVTENNARSFPVQVTNPRIRVLIVEGAPRTEYRFLRRVLESDPNLDVTAVVKVSEKQYIIQGVQSGVDLSRGLPARTEDYGSFDVVVLGDIACKEFAGLQLEYLKDFVDRGGGLLALGGYHAFGAGGYADSALAAVLPVTMGGERDGTVDKAFAPLLTPEGKAHAIFAGVGELFDPSRARAVLDGANRVTSAKPGALVLAEHPDAGADGRPMPVVAVQRYGAGRAMAFTADTTWKWKFQVEGKGLDSPYYRFWRQAIRWLASRDTEEGPPDRPVTAWASRADYEPGDAVVLTARVRNKAGEPEERATVEAAITYPLPVSQAGPDGGQVTSTGATVRLDPVPLSMGEYQAQWRPPASGLYQASVRATDGQDDLGGCEVEFVVGRAVSEFDCVDVAEQTLRSVADQTGGAFHTLATAGRIPGELAPRSRLVAWREEISLGSAPWFFAVFLACVTLEWILRKRCGLS